MQVLMLQPPAPGLAAVHSYFLCWLMRLVSCEIPLCQAERIPTQILQSPCYTLLRQDQQNL
ncbi:hypothetical protein HanIR_Chr16g0815581 [Helianthus annuus]|nr:hypothetical protein HanIR_Chr16g0815581 [Helianthus annuus]